MYILIGLFVALAVALVVWRLVVWEGSRDRKAKEVCKLAEAGDLEGLRRVVRARAPLNRFNATGLTPLCLAAKADQIPAMKLLIENGAKVDGKAPGRPLLVAAEHGRVEAARLLLENGANVNVTGHVSGRIGATSLHAAADRGDKELVDLLIGHKAKVHCTDYNESETPLHAAATGGHVDIAETLLDRGAKLDHISRSGPPVVMAASQGHLKMVQFLSARHADLTGVFSSAVMNNHCTIAEWMLKMNKAEVNRPDHEQVPPLHLAAGMGKSEMVELLLRHGADPERQTTGSELNVKTMIGGRLHGGLRPIHAAAEGGSAAAVRLLIEKGADVNATAVSVGSTQKITPLFMAAQEGHEEAVETLLRAGADPCVVCYEGRTAAEIAARNGHEKVTKLITKLSQGGRSTPPT